MADKLDNYDDVSVYSIDAPRRDVLLTRGHECSVLWSTREGWPVGVTHIFVWHDDRFWVTCTAARKRVSALRARPRSSVIVAFEGEQTVTAKTLATIHDHGSAHHDWFYHALAKKVVPTQPRTIREAGTSAWISRLDSPDRVVIELVPQKWISFDGRKMTAHGTGRWQPGDPWIEPDA